MSNTYATVVDGRVFEIIGTRCAEVFCRENGCVFPECAHLGDCLGTVEEAKEKNPDLELV